MKKTFIARDPKVPSREAIGQYFPKTDTMQLMVNGPAGPLSTPDNSPTIWGARQTLRKLQQGCARDFGSDGQKKQQPGLEMRHEWGRRDRA